jgi:hypothetical protein
MGPDHIGVAPLNVLVLILLFGLVRLVTRRLGGRRLAPKQSLPTAPRPLKAKSAADCPFCQAEDLANYKNHNKTEGQSRLPPRPWRPTRSPRGRKKASHTQGFACDNPAYLYFGITDQTRHALVADGTHTCTGAARQRGASVASMSVFQTCAVMPAATSSRCAAIPCSTA